MTSNQWLSLSLKPVDELEDDGSNGDPSLPNKHTGMKETPLCRLLSIGVVRSHPPKRRGYSSLENHLCYAQGCGIIIHSD